MSERYVQPELQRHAGSRLDDHSEEPVRRGICATLLPHPRRGIVVPLVAVVGQATKSGFDVVPAPFVLEAPSNEFGDERAAPAWARPPIDLVHEIGIQRYVQTHGPESSRVRTRRPFGSRS